ncbi:MAG: ComEC/Rec2 family competence protein [Cyanobacteria bacterium]|nr:ComEC/Rec2 family competence protein [Cyanobacteriota bacterium]MDA0866185.1 ComEC/Rec2 family competence protein [Cyanobacteriota bacterium]
MGGIVLCLAYGLGLLVSGLPLGNLTVGLISIPFTTLMGLSVALPLAWAAPRRWPWGPTAKTWILAGLIATIAPLYITWRTPVPGINDLSHFIDRAQSISPSHVLTGQVIEEPRLNQRLKGRFLLRVETLQVADSQGEITFEIPVTGKAYVTAPLLQITGLHRGQRLKATGSLYTPQPALNPNGFDFQTYLLGRGAFSGLVANQLDLLTPPHWGLWSLRQRIVRAQVKALGSPAGQVVSAMALGRRAVDLPFDIQAVFTKVGLAHTVAASGFHVSLLLGTVLALTRSRSEKLKLGIGVAVLLSYLCLTGAQPSVLRAVIMGGAALVGMASDRQVKPLGALLLAVTLLLVWDPRLIWDIGFQLSATATFGLIVTVPPLMARLTALPTPLATLLAVPLAATLWVLPLLLYHFNTFSLVSVGLSAVTTPLVMVISLGGILSGAIALVWPTAGSAVAGLLTYPVRLLMALAAGSSHLPGSGLAVGQLALWQVLGLYGLMLLAWLHPVGQRRTGLMALALGLVLVVPLSLQAIGQDRITVLAAGGELVWVWQDQGRTTLYNSGDAETAFYTVQPFLRQAGVNRVERAIAPILPTGYPSGWQTLAPEIPITTFYSTGEAPYSADFEGNYQRLQVGQSTSAGNLTLQPLGTDNPIMRLATPRQGWLMLPPLDLPLQDYLAAGAATVLPSQVLVWDGGELSEALLAAVKPTVALCYGQTLLSFVESRLRHRGIEVYWTQRDGAISWAARNGFQRYLGHHHRSAGLGD